MFKIEDGREEFYQWDLDRRLIVEDASIVEVHFCNRTDECSLVCEVYDKDGERLVNVPNILLQTDWRINVYAYDGQATKHSTTFKVNRRSKPADYVYTETEVLRYEDLEKRIENLETDMQDCNNKVSVCYEKTETIENDVEELERRITTQQVLTDGIRVTNDYFFGKRVYSIFILGGAFPNNSSKRINVKAIAEANIDNIVSIVGCGKNGNGRAQSIPFHSISGNYANVFAYSNGDVNLVANYDANNALCTSAFEIRFTIK